MVKQFTQNFDEFVNESTESEFKGLPAAEFLPLFEEVVGLCDNLKAVTYPSDIHGHAASVVTIEGPGTEPGVIKGLPINDALAKIAEGVNHLDSYYKEHDSEVTFYVWNLYTQGLSHNELEKKLEAIGGMPSYQDIRLPKLIELLTRNPELADTVSKINISLNSTEAKGFANAMGSSELGKLD